MRRALLAATTALVLAAPAATAQMRMDTAPTGAMVSIGFSAVTPTQVDVVAGDSVEWSNDSVRNHTVTDDAGAYDSGNLSAGSHWSRVFSTPGSFTYHCRLHPYIRGEVDVHRVLLERPTAPASAGHTYPLQGRAALPAGTPVQIQFDGGSGDWQPAGAADVADDGTFTLPLTPTTSGSFRAVAGDETSPPVQLLVLDRSVSARALSHGRRVTVHVTPASPGQTVVLQLHLKERFGWWPVAQLMLDKNSSATFALPRGTRRGSARVVLTLPDGATPLATGPTIKVGPVSR